jgi:glycine cleavage system aminomethyltransferase T
MYECCPPSLVVNSLQINDKFSRIALGVRYDFRSEEGYNMVGYDLTRFLLEIGVVDAEVEVKPVNFARNEIVGYKALERRSTVNVDERDIEWNVPWRRRQIEPKRAAPSCLRRREWCTHVIH